MLLCARSQIFTLGWVPKGAEVKTWGQPITNRAAGEKSPLRELVWVGVQARADSASTLRCGTGGQHCPSVYPSAGQSQVDRRKALCLLPWTGLLAGIVMLRAEGARPLGVTPN